MDRKAIIVLVISFVLILAWGPLVNHFYPPPPKPVATNEVSTTTAPLPGDANQVSPVAAAVAPVGKAGAPEQTITVTNQHGNYVFTSHGGGLKLIELDQYRADIECGRRIPAERRAATLNTGAPIPVLGLLGALGEDVYTLSKTENGVRAERSLESGLQIVKNFELSSNYLVRASVRIENRSKQPLQIPEREVVVGTATPMSAHDLGTEMGVFWYDGKDAEHIDSGLGSGFGCGRSARTEYISPAGTSNVVWGAVHNRFFTIAAVPSQPANQLISRKIGLEHSRQLIATNAEAITNGFQTSLVYPAAVLNAGDSIEKNFLIYAGPKEYNVLARLGAQYQNNLDAIMNFGGFFGWFAQGLLLSMNWLHSLGLGYGIAIIVITIIIKLIFWPLTNASTKSMKRMQLLQPQMKALQEKYKDDPRKMNMKLMEFMKEHKVSPLGGCLPMLIQIPIFIGFYQMLRSAIELRDVSFLWACDLSQADTIAYIGGFPINPLPVIWGVTMLWQARMTPISPGMDPAQQKIMRYMPLMILFFLYNMSAGLTLYWTVQNLLTILQMRLTKAVDVTPAKPAKQVSPGPKKKNK